MLYGEENEEGKFVVKSKLSVIEGEMTQFCEDLKKEMRYKCQWRNQPSWGSKIKTKLNSLLRRYRTMPNIEALKMSDDEIFLICNEFIDLVCWLNETASYVPTKQDFCAYAQISVDCYNELLASGTDEQRLMMQNIESYLSDMQLDGAQGGVVKERSTEFRLTSKDFGHSIIKKSNVEDAINTLSQEKMSPEYWIKILQSATPPSVEEKKAAVKQLKGK